MIKALLINDTSGENHVGCLGVTRAFHAICARHGIKIIQAYTRDQFYQSPIKLNTAADLILWNGEGNLIHSAEKYRAKINIYFDNVLRSVCKPTALINTVWDQFNPTPATHDNVNARIRLISCRETLSTAQVAPWYTGNLLTTPDLIFDFARYTRVYPEKRGVGYTDMLPNKYQLDKDPGCFYPMNSGGYPESVEIHLHRLAGLSMLVCGRFHSICLAAIAGTEVLAVKHNCHKNEGIMLDAGASDYYYDKPGEAFTAAINTGGADLSDYRDTAHGKIDTLFKQIKELA